MAAVVTLSKSWAILTLGGLCLTLGSLLSPSFKDYWIALFITTVPINVTKLIYYTPDEFAALKRTWHITVNENLVPLLYVSDLPLMVLLAIWFSEVLMRKTRFRMPREVLLILVFVAWCLFTLRGAPAPFLGYVWAYFELKMVLIVLWLANASLSRNSLRWIVAVLLLTLFTQSALTVVNYRWQLGPEFLAKLVKTTDVRPENKQGPKRGTGADYVYETGALLRGTGSVGAGNSEAKFFVGLLPLALTLVFVGANGLVQAIGVACYGAGLFALYLTYSRGGLLMALLGTTILLFLQYLGGHIPRKAFVTLVALGLLSLGAATPYLMNFITSRPGFLKIHREHIMDGLVLAADTPLAGVGVNNFNVAVREKDTKKTFAYMPVHNHYLRLAVEIGLVGLGLNLWFLVAFMRQAYRSIFDRDPFLAAVAMGLLAGVISILVYWMDDIFYEVVIRTEFSILLGLMLVVRQIAIKQTPRLQAAGV